MAESTSHKPLSCGGNTFLGIPLGLEAYVTVGVLLPMLVAVIFIAIIKIKKTK
jgi:hypothetical protein